VESEDAGFAKILTVRGSDKILGATIVAPHAGDLLHEFVLAMHAKIGLGKIASMIHAYPTFAELARKAGDKYNKTRLTRRAKNLALRPRAQMSNDKTGNSKSVIGRLIALLVSVIVFFLAMRFLPVQPWLRNFNDWVGQMGVAGIFIFIAVYAVATVLLAPGQC
jgi:hypothetical protein